MPTGTSPLTGYQINALDDVQAPLSGLNNAYFEAEAPLPDGSFVNLRLRGDRLAEWLGTSASGFTPLLAEELAAGHQAFAGLSLRAVLLRLINQGSTPAPAAPVLSNASFTAA